MRPTAELVAFLAELTAAIREIPVAGTNEGAEVARVCGVLDASVIEMMAQGRLGSGMSACFEALRAAGASFDDLDRLRSRAAGLSATWSMTIAVRASSVRMCLGQQAVLLTTLKLTSRDDAKAYTKRMHAVFEEVEAAAADANDTPGYQSLVTLHAAVTRDLTSRGQQLPQIVTYRTDRPLSALVLAQRLYGDAGRADELRLENKANHPLFMPVVGRALSS